MATISRKGAVTVPGTYDRPVIDHSGCPHISSRQHIMSSPTTHHEFPAALQNILQAKARYLMGGLSGLALF